MSGLEVRELRCFVAVAEELHFGRAAERLRVAQPAVSRTVAAIERRLGVTLLERSTRRVVLTEAGAVLLGEARAALEAVEAAERRTVRAGRGERRLVVAVKPDGDAGLLPAILSAFERDADAVAVDLLLAGPAEVTAALRDGRADVALVAAPFDGRGLDAQEILCEPRVAALPAGHPLAGEGLELTLDLVVAGPVATWPDADPATDRFYRGLDPDSAAPASPPAAGPAVRDLADALRLVELGRALTFLPQSVAERFRDRAISYRPVTGLSPSRVFVVWPERSRSRATAALVRTACDAGERRAAATAR